MIEKKMYQIVEADCQIKIKAFEISMITFYESVYITKLES